MVQVVDLAAPSLRVAAGVSDLSDLALRLRCAGIETAFERTAELRHQAKVAKACIEPRHEPISTAPVQGPLA